MTAETKYNLISNLLDCLDKEGLEVEFKEASDTLPRSMWETVSAFANTNGGIIILGIKEKDHSFLISGISNAAKMESDFWNTIRNRNKISQLSISSHAFEILDTEDGKQIARITIPPADVSELPVFLNGDMKQTFIRRGEGDYQVNQEELKALIRNSSTKSNDRKALKELSIDDLDKPTLNIFKSIIEARYPEGAYEDMKMEEFLLHLGLLDDSDKDNPCLFAGTLLFFGKYNTIKKYYNSYQMDFFDYRGSSERWSDRVSTDDLGKEEMNLFNFFQIVNQKLSSTAKSAFKLDENMVRINTNIREALREALVNTLVHADYSMPNGSVKIEVYDTYYRFENPGKMLIPVEKFFRGGSTKSRNDLIMSVFRRMGLSERQGYGGYQIFRTVMNNKLRTPEIFTSLEKTVLTLWIVDFPGSYPELSEIEQEVLGIITHSGFLSKGDIETILSGKYSEYKVKKALKELVDKGILIISGRGRSIKYSINFTTAEGLGQIRLLMDRLTELFSKKN